VHTPAIAALACVQTRARICANAYVCKQQAYSSCMHACVLHRTHACVTHACTHACMRHARMHVSCTHTHTLVCMQRTQRDAHAREEEERYRHLRSLNLPLLLAFHELEAVVPTAPVVRACRCEKYCTHTRTCTYTYTHTHTTAS